MSNVSRCRFDFFLVSVSLLDQFAADALNSVLPIPPTLLRVLRVFRVLRIVRLLKGAKGLRDLLMTMVYSFPALLNVGSLLSLVVFMCTPNIQTASATTRARTAVDGTAQIRCPRHEYVLIRDAR